MSGLSSCELATRRFAALSHTTRLTVFRRIMRSGREGVSAGVLAAEAGVSPSNLSAHLTILTEAALIKGRADGRRRLFAPDLDGVQDMMRQLVDDFSEAHPAVFTVFKETG